MIGRGLRTIDPEEHRNAIWQLQAKIYEDQPYVFMYSPKRKIVIHKRFDNANMYYEKPGFVLHNFNLKENYRTKVIDSAMEEVEKNFGIPSFQIRTIVLDFYKRYTQAN